MVTMQLPCSLLPPHCRLVPSATSTASAAAFCDLQNAEHHGPGCSCHGAREVEGINTRRTRISPGDAAHQEANLPSDTARCTAAVGGSIHCSCNRLSLASRTHKKAVVGHCALSLAMALLNQPQQPLCKHRGVSTASGLTLGICCQGNAEPHCSMHL